MVAGLVSGSSVTTNTNAIAAATTGVVKGAAADGTTQVILRIPASNAGQNFTVTVINDANSPSTSVPNDGGVFALGGSPSSAASSLVVTASRSTGGVGSFRDLSCAGEFLALLVGQYFDDAQRDFASVVGVGRNGQWPALRWRRPPVVLVHGLWGSAASFSNFTPLTTDTIFDINYATYDNAITGITSTTPSLSRTSGIEANSLGFAYNAPSVLAQINNFIAGYRTSANVASVKADIVAHSMGGDVSRTMFLLSNFLTNTTFPTYGAGPINKLITIATPHLGTPVAADLLASNNTCVRNVLASDSDYALASITFSGQTADGAVGDLEGNGFGSSLSPALSNLKSTQPFKTAYIAGIATSTNLNGLSCIFCTAQLVRALCSSNPLAGDLTATKWTTIYGQSNDTIVPMDSALNNLTGQQFSGVIHTAALETLDFKGPSVLDAASKISRAVISLLNEQPTGSDFH